MVNQRSSTNTTATRTRSSPTQSSGPGSQAAQQVGDTARETVSRAAETAKQQADNQRQNMSGGLQSIAQTLHQTGDNMRQGDQAMVGNLVDTAAGQIERISGYLQEHSVDEIIGDVDAFARREPVITIGVALGAGFLAARLLKAAVSRSTSGTSTTMRPYQTPAYDADRMDPMVQEEYATPGALGNRYGNGA